MAPFKRSDKKEFYIAVPTGSKWITRSTGTTRRALAERIDEAVRELHPKEGNDLDELLKAVVEGRIALSELGKDPRVSALKQLQKSLKQTDLGPVIDRWNAFVARDTSQDTADHYMVAVKSFKLFINEHEASKKRPPRQIKSADLTVEQLQDWMEQLGGEANTRRKYAAGMSSFCQYLVRKGLLDFNPVRELKLPRLGKPRDYHLETHEAERVVKKQHGDYRALAALMAGSGIEVSVALNLVVRDVHTEVKEVRARGTKNDKRDRIVRVADWAWDYFYEAVEGKEPDEKVFASIPNRWAARDSHADACAALVEEGHHRYEGYTMRDHRHTYAVRAIQAGTPVTVVAAQLGHVNGVLVVKVYANYIPNTEERGRWEGLAAAMDSAKNDTEKVRFSVPSSVQTADPETARTL